MPRRHKPRDRPGGERPLLRLPNTGCLSVGRVPAWWGLPCRGVPLPVPCCGVSSSSLCVFLPKSQRRCLLHRTCNDGKKNGDEINTDCGGSCLPCYTPAISGGYQGCFQDAGTQHDGQSQDRVCDDGQGWDRVVQVQNVEECITHCNEGNYQYMGLACPTPGTGIVSQQSAEF